MEGRILREIYDDNLKEKIRLKLLENGKIVFTVVPVGKMEDNIMCIEKPMLAHIRLTSRCNLNCSYCYAHDNSETEDMSDEQVVQLIDLCNKKGVMNITWTGGEPLLRDIFIQAVNRANRYGINQTVLTNGLKINELELEKIPKENINFQISLNNVWENPGYIQLVLENSKKLVENSYNVIISVMLKVVDISEVRQLLETLVKYSIPSVRFGVEVFVGGLKNEDVSLYESDIKKMFGNLYELREEYKNRINIFYQFDKMTFINTGFPKRFLMCEAGTTQIYIDNNGDVYPCPLFKSNREFYCGNVFSASWEELWKSEPMQKFRMVQECKDCNYQCSVWCRALLYAKNKSLYGKSPYCLKGLNER